MIGSAFNLQAWVDEHRHLLSPRWEELFGINNVDANFSETQ